ncbi:MAG: alpha/beta fold hydrolase [Anaerolineae bacterium]
MSRSRRIFKLVRFAVVLFVLMVSAVLLWMCHMQAQVLAHPAHSRPENTPDAVGITNWQTVSFSAEDGTLLSAWYIPPDANGAALIYVHGIGGNRGALRELQLFARQGYGVLALDLRNCGDSAGSATSMGYFEALDVQAAYAFLAGQQGVQRIAVYGVSMGGATAVRAMSQLPDAAALIIESSYASVLDVVGDGVRARTGLPAFPFAQIILWLTGRESGADLFDVNSERDIAQIHVPVLIMHGTADDTVPVSHGQRLYAAANEPKQLWLVEGAGHGGLLYADPQGYAAQVLPFLAAALLDA